jgi:hypothetical protein
LREFLGLTKAQFDKMQPEIKEVICKNVIPKLDKNYNVSQLKTTPSQGRVM